MAAARPALFTITPCCWPVCPVRVAGRPALLPPRASATSSAARRDPLLRNTFDRAVPHLPELPEKYRAVSFTSRSRNSRKLASWLTVLRVMSEICRLTPGTSR